MLSLLVAFLIFLIVVCVIAAIVVWIISNIPGVPPFAPRIVYAIAGVIILIWLLQHLGSFGVH
jgi:hypothetical protein